MFIKRFYNVYQVVSKLSYQTLTFIF